MERWNRRKRKTACMACVRRGKLRGRFYLFRLSSRPSRHGGAVSRDHRVGWLSAPTWTIGGAPPRHRIVRKAFGPLACARRGSPLDASGICRDARSPDRHGSITRWRLVRVRGWIRQAPRRSLGALGGAYRIRTRNGLLQNRSTRDPAPQPSNLAREPINRRIRRVRARRRRGVGALE